MRYWRFESTGSSQTHSALVACFYAVSHLARPSLQFSSGPPPPSGARRPASGIEVANALEKVPLVGKRLHSVVTLNPNASPWPGVQWLISIFNAAIRKVMRCSWEHLLHTPCHCFPFLFLMSPHCHPLTLHQFTLSCFLVFFLIMPNCFSCFSWIRHFKTTSLCHILLSGVLAICTPAEAHTQQRFHLYAKIVWTLDCTYTAAHCPDTHTHTHTCNQKGLSKQFQVLFAHSLQNGWKMEELAPNRPLAKSPKTPKWSPLKFLGSWQSEATVFGGHF